MYLIRCGKAGGRAHGSAPNMFKCRLSFPQYFLQFFMFYSFRFLTSGPLGPLRTYHSFSSYMILHSIKGPPIVHCRIRINLNYSFPVYTWGLSSSLSPSLTLSPCLVLYTRQNITNSFVRPIRTSSQVCNTVLSLCPSSLLPLFMPPFYLISTSMHPKPPIIPNSSITFMKHFWMTP